MMPGRLAAPAFTALLQAHEDPARALGLALALCAPLPARARRTRVPAGAACEVETDANAGPPSLTPAPGSVPGIDESREDLRIYRTLAASRLSGRHLAAGSRVVVSRRFPGTGDLAVVATRRAVRVIATGPGGAVPLPPDGRFLGTVEAVIRA